MNHVAFTAKQRAFFGELLSFLRADLEARKGRDLAQMMGWHDPADKEFSDQDRDLAARGFVYLQTKDRERLYKHISKLTLADAPAIMAELEANEAVGSEHLEHFEDGVSAMRLPDTGRVIFLSDASYDDTPLRKLIENWSELRAEWPASRF
jgi:hypothetical protein